MWDWGSSSTDEMGNGGGNQDESHYGVFALQKGKWKGKGKGQILGYCYSCSQTGHSTKVLSKRKRQVWEGKG